MAERYVAVKSTVSLRDPVQRVGILDLQENVVCSFGIASRKERDELIEELRSGLTHATRSWLRDGGILWHRDYDWEPDTVSVYSWDRETVLGPAVSISKFCFLAEGG